MNKIIYHRFAPAWRAGLLGATLLFGLAWAVPVNADGYEHDLDELSMVPRLVGYGCKGAGGPLYANEEDHFPRTCKAIEAWR